jgi:hypothetical protein
MEHENNRMSREDEVSVYLPSIIGIAKARFVHELSEKLDYDIIRYTGMNSERIHNESRALIESRHWTVWNENVQSFSRSMEFGHGNYVFIKFPLSYWEGLGQH